LRQNKGYFPTKIDGKLGYRTNSYIADVILDEREKVHPIIRKEIKENSEDFEILFCQMKSILVELKLEELGS